MKIQKSFKSHNMTFRLCWNFLLLVFIFTSCKSHTPLSHKIDTNNSIPKNLPDHEPNFNYIVEVPNGWTIHDITMQGGLKVRLLFSPKNLQPDLPTGNIFINWMDGNNIDDFREKNIRNLKDNMAGITILKTGNIDSTEYGGQWFTYTKDQNGLIRDMINYIIPLDGFAYMITCGCNKGSMKKYRAVFDKIAKSFKA